MSDGSLTKRVPLRIPRAEALKILREQRRREAQAATRIGPDIPIIGGVLPSFPASLVPGRSNKVNPNWEAEFDRDVGKLDDDTLQSLALLELDRNKSAAGALSPDLKMAYESALKNAEAEKASTARLAQMGLTAEGAGGLTVPDTSAAAWKADAVGIARSYGVPLDVVYAIIDIESSGNPQAQSPMNYDKAGNPIGKAQGLMQVMPFNFPKGLTEEQMRDPKVNLNVGIMILRDKYQAYGDWDKAAAAYFGAIDENGNITGATDVTGTSGNTYVAKFNAARQRQRTAMPSGGGPPAGGTTGVPGTMDAGSVLNEMKALAASGKPLEVWSDDFGQMVPTAEGSRYAVLKDLYGTLTKGGGAESNTYEQKVAAFTKARGRAPTPEEVEQLFGIGAGGADAVGLGNLEMRRQEFEYGKGQDVLARQDALQKERNAIMKAKAEAEQYLAQLEGQAQDRYSEAASWGVFPKGQPAPIAPSFPGLPGLDLEQYRVAAPDFFGPAKTARERIAAQLGAMEAR